MNSTTLILTFLAIICMVHCSSSDVQERSADDYGSETEIADLEEREIQETADVPDAEDEEREYRNHADYYSAKLCAKHYKRCLKVQTYCTGAIPLHYKCPKWTARCNLYKTSCTQYGK